MGVRTYDEVHRETVPEPVSFGETCPDLVDAAGPHGVGVRIGRVKDALEPCDGRVRVSGWGRCVGGRSQPASAAGGVVVGTRWWEGKSHIEQ